MVRCRERSLVPISDIRLDLALRYINLLPFRRPAQMNAMYEISLATPDDVTGILALQEPNLPENGVSMANS